METADKQSAAAAESMSKIGSGGSSGHDETVMLKCEKVAEGGKVEAGTGTGTGKRIARVSQKYIDILLKEKATGTGMYRPSRLTEYLEDYKGSVDLRPFVARINAIREEVRARDAAILEQYHRFGYAYDEVEEGNSFIYNEKICAPRARSRPTRSASVSDIDVSSRL